MRYEILVTQTRYAYVYVDLEDDGDELYDGWDARHKVMEATDDDEFMERLQAKLDEAEPDMEYEVIGKTCVDEDDVLVIS